MMKGNVTRFKAYTFRRGQRKKFKVVGGSSKSSAVGSVS